MTGNRWQQRRFCRPRRRSSRNVWRLYYCCFCLDRLRDPSSKRDCPNDSSGRVSVDFNDMDLQNSLKVLGMCSMLLVVLWHYDAAVKTQLSHIPLIIRVTQVYLGGQRIVASYFRTFLSLFIIYCVLV